VISQGCAQVFSFSPSLTVIFQANILINQDGEACLADFGLSSIAEEFQDPQTFTSTIGGAVRWTDALLYKTKSSATLNSKGVTVPVPGLYQNQHSKLTTHSDVYSYGSCVLQVGFSSLRVKVYSADCFFLS
jgi:serine/threonine protein kinase